MGSYDTPQICLNGHVATSSYRSSPEFRENFCKDCGQPTIYKCQFCGEEIRGRYSSPGVISIGRFAAPTFCVHCGKPYPWTSTKLEVTKALADEIEELTSEQRIMLKASIDDIAGETPKTELAVVRVKKMISGLPRMAGEALRKLVVDVASESAAKLLKPRAVKGQNSGSGK